MQERSSIDWRRKDSDRWIGRTSDGYLLLIQRASDRQRWTWKTVPPGGGVVLAAGIALDADSARASAEQWVENYAPRQEVYGRKTA